MPVPRIDPSTGQVVGYSNRMSQLDEATLREISAMTGAEYFRAGESDTVASAFSSIDRAQKIDFVAKSYLLADELFYWFAASGAGWFLLAALIAGRRRRSSASFDSLVSSA